jgi:hypothetical protein
LLSPARIPRGRKSPTISVALAWHERLLAQRGSGESGAAEGLTLTAGVTRWGILMLRYYEVPNMPKDEDYVIDLCDRVLRLRGQRQHRFDFLVGDCGRDGRCRKLPVDAYYQQLCLVVEYRERQHSEPVPIMDRRLTISGCSRGDQRRLYDQRRREVLARHNIALVEFDFCMFPHRKSKRLTRTLADEDVVRSKLESFLTSAGRCPTSECVGGG